MPGARDVSLDERVTQIAADNRSGAADLTAAAAGVLVDFAAASADLPPARRQAELLRLARRLIAAQGCMAPVLNLAARVVQAGSAADADGWAPAVRGAAAAVVGEIGQANRAIAESSLALFPPNRLARVVTLSASSAVAAALRLAYLRGRLDGVVIGESRPLYEGRTLAERLASEGINATLVVDAALSLALLGADIALVGADAVGTGGLVNKVGTHALALMARAAHVPLYALAGALKLWPAQAGAGPDLGRCDRHDPGEVYAGETSVHVMNRYFEATPLDLFAGVVLEDGIVAAPALRARLERLPLERALWGE